MARAHFTTYLTNSNGDVIPGATVSVRVPGTETLISETIYAEDDDIGSTVKGNPFTADADGKISIWLTAPKVVDLYITKTGFDPRTLRATIHSLTASTLTVATEDAPMDQRSILNFGPGFTLTDDEPNDETEVDLDFGEAGDLVDVAFSDSAVAGTLDEVARADHQHAAMVNPVTGHESTYAHADIATNVAAIAAHLADTVDAHDASAVSFSPTGSIAATDAQAAIAEVASEAATALSDHLTDTADAHDASAISVLDTAAQITATDVEGALTEIVDASQAHTAAADPHTGYQKESEKDAASGYVGRNASGRPPFFGGSRLTLAADRSISGSGAEVQFLNTATLTEDFDEGGWFTTADSKFVVPAGYTGKVRIQAHINIEGNATGARTLRCTTPSGGTVVLDRETAPLAGSPAALQIDSGPIVVTAGDNIVFYATQTSGSSLNVLTGSWVSIEFLGY